MSEELNIEATISHESKPCGDHTKDQDYFTRGYYDVNTHYKIERIWEYLYYICIAILGYIGVKIFLFIASVFVITMQEFLTS